MKSRQANNNEIITEEEEYFPEIEIEIDDFNYFNQEILNEINYAREFPQEYALKLEDILKSIKGKNDNFLYLENVPFIYKDLYGSLNDSIKFLKSQKKLPNLIYNQSISDSCEELLYEYVYNPNYKNNDSTFEKRISKYGKTLGENYEIINYDIFDPEFLVINLILSDGDKSNFSRKIIFDPNLKNIGIISGILPPYKICSIINCCEDFYEINQDVEQSKIKTKKKIFNSKILTSKKTNQLPKENKKIEFSKKKHQKKINEKQKEKYMEKNKGKIALRNKKDNNMLRNPPKKIKLNDIFYYDLENFDEDEFFEKEFDANYGKVEKERNSQKKMFSTTSTLKNGEQKTIITTIVENVDKNGVKKGYYIEKEEKNGNKTIKGRENNNDYNNYYIEKEKRDMKFLKDMERKEIERINRENYKKKKIKEIPIKLKGGRGEIDKREYFDEEQLEIDENDDLPEDAIGMRVQQKTISDSNGRPTFEVTKTITYNDGSIQKFVNKK